MFASRIQEDRGPDDIRMDEIFRRIDRAIHMRLGREIDHRKKLMPNHEPLDQRAIADVASAKFVSLAESLGDAGEILRISGISEGIEIRDHGRAIVVQDASDEIAADEAAAAGD